MHILKAFFALLVAAFLSPDLLCAQDHALEYSVGNASLPEGYEDLLLTANEISADCTLNERLLDLAVPVLLDSVVKKKAERHHVPIFGRFTRIFGFRWLRVHSVKQKFIGTTYKKIRIPDKDFFTEYDIIIDLAAHLPRYFEMHWTAREMQLDLNKRMKKKDTSKPPYVRPDSTTNMNVYRMHCEHTPLIANRDSLHKLFFPCLKGGSYITHPNFGERNPSFGMYGTICLDCNHSCHPEVHPYEWIWWLNLNPAKNFGTTREWVVGLFREGSNRFRHWSRKTRTGEIAIPFVFQSDQDDFKIELEHLMISETDTAKLAELSIPDDAVKPIAGRQNFSLNFPGGKKKQLNLVHQRNTPASGVKVWLTDLNHDKKKNLFHGMIHVAASVEDLYAFKIRW